MNNEDPRLKVVNLVDVPRGGWRYSVLDTNTTIQAGSIPELKRRVKAHMQANGIEIPKDIDEEIEDGACLNLEQHRDHWCRERRPNDHSLARQRPRWRASEVVRFLKTVWNWGTMEGFNFVSMVEAERRAAICASCPMNVSVSGCLGCTGVASMVRKIRGEHKTRYDLRLNACNVCGCELKVKVLVPAEVIDNRGLEYPSWCWQSTAATPASGEGDTAGHQGEDQQHQEAVGEEQGAGENQGDGHPEQAH